MNPQGHYSDRCDCRAGGPGHSSNSGRCNERDVSDPTAILPNDAVYCDDCRGRCNLQHIQQVRLPRNAKLLGDA